MTAVPLPPCASIDDVLPFRSAPGFERVEASACRAEPARGEAG